MDGLEDDPGTQAALGVDLNPPSADWFTPFNSERSVHPYAETPANRSRGARPASAAVRWDDSPRDVLVPEVVDAATPLASFAAGQRGGRAGAASGPRRRRATGGLPMTSDRELVLRGPGYGRSGYGSGRLEWELDDGAGTVALTRSSFSLPHRHFPVGDDQPWVDAAIGYRTRCWRSRCGSSSPTGPIPGCGSSGTEGSHGRPRASALTVHEQDNFRRCSRRSSGSRPGAATSDPFHQIDATVLMR